MVERILFGPGGATEAKQDAIITGLGTVGLSAATLAALENVTVAIQAGQIVGLDSATLAALEAVTVSGTLALDAPTLAALENVNAAVTGTVALDAPTVAALQAVTATVSGAVSITNFPATYPLPTAQVTALTPPAPQTDALTDAQLRATSVPVTPPALVLATDSVRQTLRVSQPLSVNVIGAVTDSILVAVGPTERIRLIRNAGHVDPALALETYPIVTLKIGTTVIYRDKLEAGLPWSETVCFEGAAGDDLTISIDIPATIYLNCRYEVFPA